MQKPMVLVTAAAGKTGFATASQLLAKRFPVRAFVHRRDSRSESLQRSGAEIVVGSLTDIGDVRSALQGVRRAYFCAPLIPGCLTAAAVFAAAANEHRLEALVTMSQWLADPGHPSVHTRETWLAEALLSSIPGIAHTTVNPGWFADNYMAAMEPIAQFGLMPMPLGEGLNAPPSNEDIARVISAVLADPDAHAGKTYRPTGPKLLSPREIAGTFAKVLGHRVTYVNAPIAMFSKVAKGMGYPEFTIAQVEQYFRDYRRNAFAAGAPTAAVLDVTGQPAEDFETIVRRYVEVSPAAQRRFGSQVTATLKLMHAMLMPGPRTDRHLRPQDFSDSGHARLAADSPTWIATHDSAGSLAAQGGNAQVRDRVAACARSAEQTL